MALSMLDVTVLEYGSVINSIVTNIIIYTTNFIIITILKKLSFS